MHFPLQVKPADSETRPGKTYNSKRQLKCHMYTL